MGSMDGKVAIVTGAARGIGRDHALLLAKEGAKVVVNDFGGAVDGTGGESGPADDVVNEIKTAGGEAIAQYGDITKWDDAKALITTAIETFGDLHALVNNAGIVRDSMLFKMTESDFDAVVAVHLKGHFLTARHAAEYWRTKSKEGVETARHIVNTTSTAGLIGNVGQTNYGAAKAGIANFTQIWNQELSRYGVRINGIAPVARTRMTEGAFGAMEFEEGEFDTMDPANISPLVVYLASDLSNDVSGEIFQIRGGDVARFIAWTNGPQLCKDERWIVQGLADNINELF